MFERFEELDILERSCSDRGFEIVSLKVEGFITGQFKNTYSSGYTDKQTTHQQQAILSPCPRRTFLSRRLQEMLVVAPSSQRMKIGPLLTSKLYEKKLPDGVSQWNCLAISPQNSCGSSMDWRYILRQSSMSEMQAFSETSFEGYNLTSIVHGCRLSYSRSMAAPSSPGSVALVRRQEVLRINAICSLSTFYFGHFLPEPYKVSITFFRLLNKF